MADPLTALRNLKPVPSHLSGPTIQAGPGPAVDAAREANLKAKIEPKDPRTYPDDTIRGDPFAHPDPIRLLRNYGLDPADPANIGGSGEAAAIPMWRLNNMLKSGLGDELIKSVRSPLLRSLHNPPETGSSVVASTLSGIRPSSLFADVPKESQNIQTINRYVNPGESRQASAEMHRITQQALQELGINPGESVDLFRSGPIPKTPWILSPTHVDPDMVENWNPWPGGFHKFQVPRENIRALMGLLRRGDDLTTGEALVPAQKLIESSMDPIPSHHIIDSDFFEGGSASGIYTRTPGWHKKTVLK